MPVPLAAAVHGSPRQSAPLREWPQFRASPVFPDFCVRKGITSVRVYTKVCTPSQNCPMPPIATIPNNICLLLRIKRELIKKYFDTTISVSLCLLRSLLYATYSCSHTITDVTDAQYYYKCTRTTYCCPHTSTAEVADSVRVVPGGRLLVNEAFSYCVCGRQLLAHDASRGIRLRVYVRVRVYECTRCAEKEMRLVLRELVAAKRQG
jgi:hypothetical protein